MTPPTSPERCVFCRIASGTSPAHVVHDEEELIAFLDINPIRPGHLQIIPKQHFPYFDDIPPALAGRILALGQRLAGPLKQLFGVRRVAFCFSGNDIAHAHAHLLPLHNGTDITSRRYIAEETLTFRPTPRMPDDELAQIAARIRATAIR